MSSSASTIEVPPVALPGRRPDPSLPHAEAAPARAGGVELLGTVAGSGYRRAPALVRRADGQTVQLTPLLFELFAAIDGTRGHTELAALLGDRTGRQATGDDVRFLVETKLRPLGLLRGPDGTEPSVQKADPLLALRWKLVVSDPAATRRLTAPFAPLFRPTVVAAFVLVFALTTGWLAFEKGLASAAHQALYEPALLLLVFALTVLSAGFHEIGHAAACRYSGARAGGMGVGLYLVWPAFYTDVTDSYRLGRGSRLRVDLGGLYFNAIFGVGIFALWAFTDWDALLLVLAAQAFQMVRQLVPIVRFDGYHILADLVGVPDLFAHIKPTLLGLLPWRWGRPEGKALKPWARAVVTLWVLVVVPLLAALLVLVVLVLPRIVATAWDSLGLQWEALAAGWGETSAAAVALALVSMLLICLPVAGICYLLVRVTRRLGRWVWRTTDSRPLLRVGAGLAGAALLAGLAWAWWPDERYRPIELGEQWRLVAPRPPGEPPVAPPAQVVGEPAPLRLAATVERDAPVTRVAVAPPAPAAVGGRKRVALLLLPADAVPAAPAPAPAGPVEPPPPLADHPHPPVLPLPAPVPEPAGDDTPATVAPPSSPVEPDHEAAWVFPFAPPRQPVEGDNQAVAINTQDGSTKADFALALVWVTDGSRVEQRNEAYAYASCVGCRTVAVAFQVILVVGYVEVLAPVNAAVAASYECTTCLTHALAVQLVATLTRLPSERTLAELAATWQQLEALGDDVDAVPITQLHAVLLQARTRVLQILAQDDGVSAPGDAPAAPAEVDVEQETDGAEDAAPSVSATSAPGPPAGPAGAAASEVALAKGAAEESPARGAADDPRGAPCAGGEEQTTPNEPAQESTTEPVGAAGPDDGCPATGAETPFQEPAEETAPAGEPPATEESTTTTEPAEQSEPAEPSEDDPEDGAPADGNASASPPGP